MTAKLIAKKIITYIFCILAILPIFTYQTRAAELVAGAVNNWYNLSSATYLSVDMKPSYGENGYHYYSLSSYFEDKNYGLYSGIQTNGNIGGHAVGNMFIFSIWNATVAIPENGATATPFSGEGIGYSLRKPYDWVVGDTYNVSIKREAFDPVNNGYRWSAAINHKENGTVLKIGEIVAPSGANLIKSGSLFHERYGGITPVCSSSTSNLEKAGVIFSNLTSDKSVSINNIPSTNNIFSSIACAPYIHSTSISGTISTGFGMTNTEFINGPIKEIITPSNPIPTTPNVPPETNQPVPPTTNTPPVPEIKKPTQVQTDDKPIVPLVTTDADIEKGHLAIIEQTKKDIFNNIILLTIICITIISIIIAIILMRRKNKII